MTSKQRPIEWYLVEYPNGRSDRLMVYIEGGNLLIRGRSVGEHEVPAGSSIKNELELHLDVKIVDNGSY